MGEKEGIIACDSCIHVRGDPYTCNWADYSKFLL